MGLFMSYLDKPITDKESQDESNDKLICGASSMQGWRLSQEDAHNCILDYDTNTSFFAVYDGHGGHEVSLYCSKYLPEFIKNTPEYKENKIEEALTEGFLRFDAEITKPEVIKVLQEMVAEEQKRRKEMKIDEESDDDDDEENVDNLYEEAAMPIEQVIEKYTSKLKSEKKEKDSDSTVGTSASSSGSSSRQTPEKCADGVSSSSEAESTTDKKSTKIKEVNGPEEKPTVSNSSDTTHQVESSEQKSKEALTQNGEVIIADSVSQAKNDVTSSSATLMENGTPSKKGKGKAIIKPEPVKTPNPRPKRNAKKLYEEWLNNHEESEEESDEEEDQTFEGPNEESSEDDADGVNVAVDASEDSSEEGEEEEDDEDDEEEEEDDEETAEHNLKFARNIEELPGSDSGCTAVVALLHDNELYVANSGDSRCIVCRNGKAIEMSFDHKPEDKPEYDRIVKAGGKVSMDGRVNGGLNLSRAIGDHAYKQNKELSDREQMITALPDIKKLTINPSEDEFMVLACDGIWNSMSSQEVVDFVKPRISDGREKMSTICEEMFDHCLSPSTFADGAGCDNMTAIVIKFKSKLNKRTASPSPTEENNAKRAKTEESETQVDTTV